MDANLIFGNATFYNVPPTTAANWLCKRRAYRRDVDNQNIIDVIDVMQRVMSLCRIPKPKIQDCTNVLHYGLTHYTEMMHSIDRWPRKRIRKEDLMHKLGCRAHMTRFEAQVTYTIFKRLFHAYHQRPVRCSIDVKKPEVQTMHSDECRWVHAAKRTAQIYGMYEGLLPSVQKDFEKLLNCIYKRLFDRIKERIALMVWPDCDCRYCAENAGSNSERASSVVSGANVIELPQEMVSMEEMAEEEEGAGEYEVSVENSLDSIQPAPPNLRRSLLQREYCKKCQCQTLTCLCGFDEGFNLIKSHEGGQDGFRCLWVPAVEPWFEDPIEVLPDDISVCPPCQDDEDVCICGEYCECEHFFENETKMMDELSGEGIESNSEPWGPMCDLEGSFPGIDQREPNDEFGGCRIAPCVDGRKTSDNGLGEKGSLSGDGDNAKESTEDGMAGEGVGGRDGDKGNANGDAKGDAKGATKGDGKGDSKGKGTAATKGGASGGNKDVGKGGTKVHDKDIGGTGKGVGRLGIDGNADKGGDDANKSPDTQKSSPVTKLDENGSGRGEDDVFSHSRSERESKIDLIQQLEKPSNVKAPPLCPDRHAPKRPMPYKKVIKTKPKLKLKPKPCPKATCKKRCPQPPNVCDDPWDFGGPYMLF